MNHPRSTVGTSLLALALLLATACGPRRPALHDIHDVAAPKSAARAGGPDPRLTIPDDDRTCADDRECTNLRTRCSSCEGGCTGVRVDRADRFDGLLDCSAYEGAICDYDCQVKFGMEFARCISGRCESVKSP